MNPIKFGTDGWRDRMDEDFTVANVQLVTQALVDYLKDAKLAEKGVVIGYDNRSRSEDFARAAAEICSGAGIPALLTQHSVSSPVVSYTVNNLKLGAGIMITASHNPPVWNGFKIKEGFGGSAFPETTREVEKRLRPSLSIKPSSVNVQTMDPTPSYFKKISSLVNLDLIKRSKLNIIIDAMHGSGAGYFAALGIPVTELRGKRDPQFGGVNPEPLPVNLKSSISFIERTTAPLTAGIVLDGDADRLAAIDASGRFINTHNVFVLLLQHLFVHRKLAGEVVKTFNLSNLIDELCRAYGLKLTVTPIGFKHIARIMLERDVLLGGEESGGMGVKGNIPERDGVLAGLMLLELMAYEKKTLGQILDGIMQKHGYFYYDRFDLHTDKAQAMVEKLKASPPDELKAGRIETLDGLKFNFPDKSWVLFRASGTEPLLRIYAEGRTEDQVRRYLALSASL